MCPILPRLYRLPALHSGRVAVYWVVVDPDYGLIYALGEENNQIIYVELIFCNYFYDIDFQNEIDIQYLPIGFDATPDNEYRQKRLKR